MKSEFALAFNEITERFSLPPETVMEALEAAMISAYRRSVNASSAQNVEVKILPESGGVEIFVEKEAVEAVENEQTEVVLEIAQNFDPEAELGDMVMVESTPKDFGRVAAQTAKQVILQRLREAEREAQYEEYVEREGDLVHGTVHSVTPQSVTVGLGRAEAILPRNQQIPGEHFRVRDRIRTYVLEVRRSPRGPVIVVSRTHPHMLRRLLEMEVPEINQGLVEIKSIAREAGKRAKVAVAALREGVDPVGACVGMRGVRIQSIVRDLSDEKIDVIEWHPDTATFVAKALAPARVSGVYLSEEIDRGKTAIVVVPEDQLSLAIGRAGVNARLGAKLTGWRIDIKSLPETAVESLMILTTDSSFAEVAEEQAETVLQVEAILTKKEEGRPITPEEYQTLTSFVDRVQKEIESRRDARRQFELEKLAEVRDSIPETAFEVELTDVELSTRVQNLLVEAGYKTAGQVLQKLGMDADAILALPGIGPKAMIEIAETLNSYEYPEPVVEIEEVAEEEVITEEVEGEPAAVLETEEAVEVEITTEAESPVVEDEVGAEEIVADAVEELAEKLGESIQAPEVSEDEFAPDSAEQKQRRKEQSRIMEFDPELGEVVVRRRRKRDEDAWDKGDY
ncbi:MAG: transcription termination/antitermination protein NusA [Anaerolineales bacterium]|nr:transcription termination/antitermination protein NusA [Anaerolineales bacterium]